jgi:hydrogenase/urease accessory protein HupE
MVLVRTFPALLLMLLVLGPAAALGHESQPGSVTMRELQPGTFEITWRAPIYYGKPHPARLELPDDWRIIGQSTQQARADAIIFKQTVSASEAGIDGQIIRFPGLESTITDVFIRVTRADGSVMSTVARPTKPWAELRGERPWQVTAGEYLFLGFHHILLGIDHLLFVLGLLLIVRQLLMLIKTISSFTIAHSITLGAATLGYAHLPIPPLNTAIALSILFLGPEIIRLQRGETSLTIRYPWLIAFGFGLLHGFGFASGLSTTGMPRAELPWALLWFNVGVELGQILFVLLALSLLWSFIALKIRWPRWSLQVPAYTVGSLGAYWTIQRGAILLGGF